MRLPILFLVLFTTGCGGRTDLDANPVADAAAGGDDAAADAACSWSFGPPANYMAGEAPVAVAAGDFDQDGHPDLAVNNQGGYTTGCALNTLHNLGDGTFALSKSYLSEVAFDLAVGPFETRQSTDIVVGCQLFAGSGNGSFAPPVTYSPGSCGFQDPTNNFVSADFDGDGRLDFAWASYDTIAVYLNRGAGDFDEVDTTTYAESIATADFDGDGHADLASVNWGYGNPSYLKILLGVGDGTFHEQDIPQAHDNLSDIAAGDFNGDGQPDIVVTDLNDSTMDVWINDGDAMFRAGERDAAGWQVRSIAVGDLNGDGAADIAMADYSGYTLDAFLNRGDGTFAPKQSWPLESGPDSVTMADFNSDGLLDVAIAGPSEDPTKEVVTVFLSECK